VTTSLYKYAAEERKTIGIKQISKLKKDQSAKQEELISAKQQAEKELSRAKKELERIDKEKETLISTTKAEIEKEKENWMEEKKKWIKAAEKEGYEAGFSRGREESLQEFSNLTEQANAITESALKDYNKTIEKSEEKILDLAIHTASRIMKQQIDKDPSSFLPILKAAIKELKDQRIITIYLHPKHYHTVMEQKDELVHILEDDMKLSIYVDENLTVNGCLIHHPFGQIDAGVDTQLEQIRKALFEIAMESRT
jgi:flagellar assembly protein FliH